MFTIDNSKLSWLFGKTIELVRGSRLPNPQAGSNAFYYCPDGAGKYRGIWCRDFAYIVENVPELVPADEIRSICYTFLRHQNSYGGIPTMITPAGEPRYITTGPQEFTDSDNTQFLIKIINAYYHSTSDIELFASMAPRLDRAMDATPRSSLGLVWVDPDHPHTSYGFTDTVVKTGHVLMCTLLYWEACRIMIDLSEQAGRKDYISKYQSQATMIEQNLGVLWNKECDCFNAASMDGNRPDPFSNAYSIYAGFPLGKRVENVMNFIRTRYDDFVYEGQVRHLLRGDYWDRTIYKIPRDEYQNGAYWAVASGWVLYALAQTEPEKAAAMISDLIDSFQARGIYECINKNYTKIENYVASVTNPVGAIKKLLDIRDITTIV
jgi:glycogen debranching enzyme